MDCEIYSKVRKGKINALRALQDEELPYAWFVCYCMTGEVSSAAELLRITWKNTIQMLVELGGCPRKSFRACFSEELYRTSEEIPPGNEMFLSFPIPTLPQKFDSFVEEIKSADSKERIIYLLNKLGDLGNGAFSELLGIPLHEAKEYLFSLEKKIHPRQNGKDFTDYIRLSNEFRYTNRQLFESIILPDLFIHTLEHDYNSIYNTSGKFAGATRKDSKEMAQQGKKPQAKQGTPGGQGAGINRRAAQKKKKTIIISAVVAVLVIAIIVAIVLVAQRNNMPETTRITSYNIDAVTYGNVSTTISGSGSLSPITKATLTLADCLEEEDTETDTETDTDASTETDTSNDSEPAAQSDSGTGSGANGGMPSLDTLPTITGVISDVAVSVGDTVTAGEVIAVVTFDDETTANIIAPYDAVLLEFYLHNEDEVTMTSNVAMFMGTDGYSMTISVDETNISTVELGQEVDISIDAVTTDNELVGSVTDISYNGSTSGSVTSYGITVTFDYVEGTYPGMSVSAEIVIEDSGDGLLVPVDAVYTSGDTKYVYLAPDGATLGDEYEEGTLDTSKLTKVTVETGMSDGTYMLIESSSLEEGDLIVITKITSNLTGSDSEGDGGRGDFGGGSFGGGSFGGGGFPGGELPEGFDPSQFGGSFPGFGG